MDRNLHTSLKVLKGFKKPLIQSWGGGQLKKSLKKSKSISGILGWVLTFFDPKF